MKPTCKKCGRPLRDPLSIAIGVGPECRGATSRSSRSPKISQKRSHGSTYGAAAVDARSAALANGQPIETGLRDARTKQPLVYLPDGRGNYIDQRTGRAFTRAEVRDYLEFAGLIHKTSLPQKS